MLTRQFDLFGVRSFSGTWGRDELRRSCQEFEYGLRNPKASSTKTRQRRPTSSPQSIPETPKVNGPTFEIDCVEREFGDATTDRDHVTEHTRLRDGRPIYTYEMFSIPALCHRLAAYVTRHGSILKTGIDLLNSDRSFIDWLVRSPLDQRA